MTLIYNAFHGTDLSNADLASITGLSESHIGGIYGRNNNFHVTVDYDGDPASPREWDTPTTVLWAQLRDQYTTGRSAGTDVPAALAEALDTWMPETRHGYRTSDYEFRVLKKYAALHGYRVQLHRFAGTSPSDWTDFVFLTPATAEVTVIDDLIEAWRIYWDGEVYTATIDFDDTERSTLHGIYGDDTAETIIADTVRAEVNRKRSENRLIRQLMFA